MESDINLASCDKTTHRGRCSKKPYVEVYFQSKTCGVEGLDCPYGCTSHWSYLCLYHFVIDLLKNKLFKTGRGYCYVSNKKVFLRRLLDKLDNGELDE